MCCVSARRGAAMGPPPFALVGFLYTARATHFEWLSHNGISWMASIVRRSGVHRAATNSHARTRSIGHDNAGPHTIVRNLHWKHQRCRSVTGSEPPPRSRWSRVREAQCSEQGL